MTSLPRSTFISSLELDFNCTSKLSTDAERERNISIHPDSAPFGDEAANTFNVILVLNVDGPGENWEDVVMHW
jgi:hypothetical protein